jgi:hypothetical protein
MARQDTHPGRLGSMRRILVFPVLLLLGTAALALPPGRDGDQRRPLPSWAPAAPTGSRGRGATKNSRPDEIVRTMALKKGDAVADLGGRNRLLHAPPGARGRPVRRGVRRRHPARDAHLLKANMEKAGVRNVVPFSARSTTRSSRPLPRLGPPRRRVPRAPAAEGDAGEGARGVEADGRVALVEYRLEGLTALHVRRSTACRRSRCSPSGSRPGSGS